MGISGFVMEDSGVFMDVRASFLDYVHKGITISEATKSVCEMYNEMLTDDEDAVFAWSGLLDAQREAGRILMSTKRKCLSVLERELARVDAGEIEVDDLDAYRIMLSDFRAGIEVGMSKAKSRQMPISCEWRPGDVYAVRLVGDDAKLCGLEGRYLLLRMTEPIVSGQDVYPYVYMSVSATTDFPHDEAGVAAATYIRVSYYRSYRIALVSRTQKEFQNVGFQYVGNFPAVASPEDEVVLPEEKRSLFCTSTLVEYLVERACDLYAYFVLDMDLSAIKRR